MSTSERNGDMVGAVQVFEGDELMLISNQGTLVRTRTDEVSVLSRNTQGVRVIRTKEGESLVGVQRIEEPDELPEPEAGAETIGADSAGAESSSVESNSADPDSAEPDSTEDNAD